MSEHLDNPIWNALTTLQSGFGERAGGTARFFPQVTALAGLAEQSLDALATLAAMVQPGERAGLFLDEVPDTFPGGLVRVDGAPLAQFVNDGPFPERTDDLEIVELTAADNPEMRALAEATRPGPFGTRTHELGTFLGVRDGTRLIAMAGQRMRLPGRVEISAVCTDPAYLGRGLAARLMTAQLALLGSQGVATFLHVKADNARAIALYERLGFRLRRRATYVVLSH
ncbi:MAG TPA: GNAT family N-acetyltransferase [Kofleriaceae bacterium]|nr:GNAT family N-acetyltransferase [Kofleriaceae bacterium]